MASNHDSIIDVTEAVASSIEMNPLWSHGFRESPKSCIFTVPNSLSRHNPEAYKPKFISIGPLHHSEKHLKDAQNIKFQYLSGLVSRVGIPVKDMITTVAKLEPEAREHYVEQINLSQAEFVEIMVLDGCFIIEYLRKVARLFRRDRNDPVLNRAITVQDIVQDLMLLENQIPWMILHQLFTLTIDKKIDRERSLVHLALNFFNREFGLCGNYKEELVLHLASVKFHHILELARYVLIFMTTSTLHNKPTYATTESSIPTAVDLENAGVTLKRSQSKGLSISFKDGVLEIPRLQIFDETEGLFRNLIAFEQCSIDCPTLISSYARVLTCLIKTTTDIDCMSRNDIINVQISLDDALGFFNKLGNAVLRRETMYPNLAPSLNDYTRHRWPRWRAMLIRNYFGNPWVITSTVAAFVLLVLTFLQTLYTMKG